MKLASLRAGRDGRLIVVSRDLQRYVEVAEIAPTLQAALDCWEAVAPELERVAGELDKGRVRDAAALDPRALAAPLPRAYQWADGSAYVHHVELVRKARGAELPASFWSDPLMYQGGSDQLIGPRDDLAFASEEFGIDFEAELCVITDDVAMGSEPAAAERAIRLLTVVNDVSLRNLIPDELAKGFGFFHGKPASSFAPVAVTPDELGDAWNGKKLQLELCVWLNGEPFGHPNAGEDMIFDFPTLVAHAARTRALGAGTLVGSGTVSNRDPSFGSCCIAERRMLELLEYGEARTPFLHFGDRVVIDMLDREGRSIFGAIDQRVVPYGGPDAP